MLTGICAGSAAASVVDLTSPTTSWTVVSYGSNTPDPSNDQQTGSSEGDIVGNALHPSVYTTFGDAGTPSLIDGTLAFRVRLGADTNPAGFKTAFFVGVDANHDGALDLFLGVNNSGSADTVGIWRAGAGLNISPSTTTIVSVPVASYTPTASNYVWTPVTLTNDPTVGSATDIDGGGQNDHFLSFSVPFTDVITQLTALGITGVDQNSALSYVMATATQANSLNQDLNGVGKTYDGSATWAALGAQSDFMTASGIAVVPEANPTVFVILLAGLAIGCQHWNARKTILERQKNARTTLAGPLPRRSDIQIAEEKELITRSLPRRYLNLDHL
jgi:hypothetical protein